jgi:hypothetical protein
MPVQNYETHLQRQQVAQEAAEKQARSDAAWEEILLAYPIASHTANKKMVLDFCGGEIALHKFEYLLKNKIKGFSLDWTDEREELLKQILDLLEDKFQRRMTEHDLKAEQTKMSHWTREQLRTRLAQVKTKQAMAKKSVGELHADLSAHREQEQESAYGWKGQYPRLLSTLVPKQAVPEMNWGTVAAIPTGAYFRYISKKDYETFKKFCKLYSLEQVNYWLNQP